MSDIKSIAEAIEKLTVQEASTLIKKLERTLYGVAAQPSQPSPVLTKRPYITRVWAIYEDGTEEQLTQKLNSKGNPTDQSFFCPINYGSYEITLRLDWTSCDENGDPMLDAEIREEGLKLPYEKWHWTPKGWVDGELRYDFSFKGLTLRLRISISNLRTLQGTARILPPIEPTV